ncbi:T9SS type A sorting domain-containing protein [Flammeovirga sp. EKP202]|uniref:T9SS type A sorting domain-containing protein n=1 Tax=Flammeovirga sp. EKP202 TaxID=2770592 RepID=UPI00165F61C2|nr:T9SS type A sorting domain-containing protein [Flammeovirga sp. EKP202]MBD0401304.1 T9SS type A sorting domain-containing protein [Flammeovirga sp. EKP202]
MRYYLLISLLLFYSSVNYTFSQTGPGGVGTTDGTSTLEYWLDANNGVSGASPITSLTDLSGNFIAHSIQGNPALTDNKLNGRSVITFDGIGDHIKTTLSINTDNIPNATIIAVYTPRIDDAGAVWGEDNIDWDRFLIDKSNNMTIINSAISLGPSDLTLYDIPKLFTAGEAVISNVFYQEGVVNGTTVTVNEELVGSATANHGYGYSSVDFTIGAIGYRGFEEFFFDGDIAEVIVFSEALNEAERRIISNYLSAKYNIPLTSYDDYVQDDNSNGDFDFDVAGIGRVDISNISQDGKGSGIVRILNPTDLDDGEFLYWGHNNGTQEAIETSDVPLGVSARFNRLWRVSEVVSNSNTAVDVGSIDIRFDLSGLGVIDPADISLLVDTDNDGVFNDETPITGATYLGSNIYEFTGVSSLSNNVRFTVGTSGGTSLTVLDKDNYIATTSQPLGPGGVGSTDGTSNLDYWMDANNGVIASGSVTAIEDLSGNAIASTITGDPILTTLAMNGYSTITFDGVGDYIVTNLSINKNDLDKVSVVSVYRARIVDAGGVWGEDDGEFDRFILDLSSASPYLNNSVSTGSGTEADINNIFPVGSSVITSVLFDEGETNGSYVYANETLERTFTSIAFSETSNNFTIGNIGSLITEYDFDGDISEVAVYGDAINEAQRIIIHNALSAKYNVPLTSNDLYDGDDSANGNYDHEVAGVGKIDVDNVHLDAQGSIVRMIPVDNLEDNSFFFWGHNNGRLEATEKSDIPLELVRRFERVWRVSEVNTSSTSIDIGGLDIYLDLSGFTLKSGEGLALLVDTDGDGSFKDESPIFGAVASGDYYFFSNVTALTDNVTFTFGTNDDSNTPLLSDFFVNAPKGPGGIGNTYGTSDLEYWIDANNGITGTDQITGVSNLSGTSSTNIVYGNPELIASAMNGYNTIRFDGTRDYITTDLSINKGDMEKASIVSVYKPRIEFSGGVWGEFEDASDRFLLDQSSGSLNNSIANGDATVTDINNIFPVGSSVITTVIFQAGIADDNYVYANETLESNFDLNTNTATTSNTFTIGNIGSLEASHDFDGDISEIVLYKEALNDAQRIILHNSLSAKYDIPLTSNDLYDEDDASNGDYDHDVAGIGRVDADNYHYDAQGTGIVRITPTSGSLADDQFLIWGHDNGTQEALEEVDVPAGVASRFSRVWRVSEVNTSKASIDVGNLEIYFDLGEFTITNKDALVLLVDTNNDGLFSDETPITGVNEYGDYYYFSNVSALTDNSRFTLGTTDASSISLLSDFFTKAPTGPAGIGNFESNVAWLNLNNNSAYSDEGVNQAFNEEKVRQWNDNSGNSRNAFSTDTDHQPVYVTDVLNGQSALRFEGDQFIDLPSLDMNSTTSATYIVAFQDTASTLGNHYDDLGDFIVDRTTESSPLFNLKLIDTNNYAYQKRNNAGSDIGGPVSTTSVNTDPKIIGYEREYGVDYRLYYNNTLEDSEVESDGPSTPPDPRLGRHILQPNTGLRGYMYEFIVYNEALNDAQMIIVNNYLSAKYDIPLGSYDLYDEDDSSNGDFDFEVTGIGRVDADNYHYDAEGSGIVRITPSSGILSDNQFMIWGHDNGNLEALETVDVPTLVEARFNRVWRVSEVDNTGASTDIGAVDIYFNLEGFEDLTASDLVLIVDTDNDGSFTNETSIFSAVEYGKYFVFQNVTALSDNVRFTLGTADEANSPLKTAFISGARGPGGVGNDDNNLVWLKADENVYSDEGITLAVSGDNVRQWNNQHDNGINAYSETVSFQPIYAENVQNGQPGLRFSGTNYMDLNSLGISGNSSATYVVAFQDTTVGTLGNLSGGLGDYIIDRSSDSDSEWPLYSLKKLNGNFYGYQKRTDDNTNLGGITSTTAINTDPKVIQYQRNYGESYEMFYNNTLESSLEDTDGFITPQQPRLGHETNGFRGYMYEFAIYNEGLNEAQTIIVNNYLAAKYDINLTSNDIYDEDKSGDYDFDVAGIGQVDAENYHYDAQGSGIVRITPTYGSMSDDQFLIWGHDNGTAESIEMTDIPSGVTARFERVWRVSEVSSFNLAVDVGRLEIYFELIGYDYISSPNLVLLIDTDNDGFFSDETPIYGAETYGDYFLFSNVDKITNNRRFTLGTTNGVMANLDLPIELSLFKAKVVDNEQVHLMWKTASETNNEYFTIFKSVDGRKWEELVKIAGAGNSSQALSYSYIDQNPFIGVSYYRLKQTDFDSKYEYSNALKVYLKDLNTQSLKLFPNPTEGSFSVIGNNADLKKMRVYNVLGQEVTGLVVLISDQGNRVDLDASKLKKGLYYLKTRTSSLRFYRK